MADLLRGVAIADRRWSSREGAAIVIDHLAVDPAVAMSPRYHLLSGTRRPKSNTTSGEI